MIGANFIISMGVLKVQKLAEKYGQDLHFFKADKTTFPKTRLVQIFEHFEYSNSI